MTEEQIELLRKALSLYNFTIDQRDDNTNESNEFYYMVNALEKLIGLEINY